VANFGVMAAEALEAGKIDGFWANGMGTEVAVRRGVGSLVADARRGDGPAGSTDYTAAIVAATDRLVEGSPAIAAAAVRAIRRAHALLRADVARATEVGRKLFPPAQAALIAELIRRDLPFYDAAIPQGFVAGMQRFARDLEILDQDVPYEAVVATQLAPLWRD
jgi:ABC-type nitrate/sulfonate/bicarbonate transport system substrate-binding protein